MKKMRTLESRYRRLRIRVKCQECNSSFKAKGPNIHNYREGDGDESYFSLSPSVKCNRCGNIIPIESGIDPKLEKYILAQEPTYI